MATNSSSNQWLWFIAKRCCVYLLIGAVVGAIGGAFLINITSAITVMVLESTMPHLSAARLDIFGVQIPIQTTRFGTTVGLYSGSLIGGCIGLLSWALVGIIARPSKSLIPSLILIRSMLNGMGVASIFGLICTFLWPALIGPFRYGYIESLQSCIFCSIFGIPVLMGIGQSAGVWRYYTTEGHVSKVMLV